MVRYAGLPKITQMNVDCNKGAKAKAREPHLNKMTNTQRKYWGVYYQGKRSMNNMADQIEKAGQDVRPRKYWIKKKQHTEEQDRLMEWEALGKVQNKESIGFNVVITKLYSGNFGCNATLYSWSMRGDNKCPQCGTDNKVWNTL